MEATSYGYYQQDRVRSRPLLEAHRSAGQLRGQTNAQMAAWLRRILANNLADELQRLRADKGDVSRERPIEQAIDEGAGLV